MNDYLGNIKIIHDLNSIDFGFECQICSGSQSGNMINNFPVCNNCKSELKEIVLHNRKWVEEYKENEPVKKNILYIDLPYGNPCRNIENLEIGDTLEVRLSELQFDLMIFWDKLKKVKCNRIELELKDTNDAYGLIQLFKIL